MTMAKRLGAAFLTLALAVAFMPFAGLDQAKANTDEWDESDESYEVETTPLQFGKTYEITLGEEAKYYGIDISTAEAGKYLDTKVTAEVLESSGGELEVMHEWIMGTDSDGNPIWASSGYLYDLNGMSQKGEKKTLSEEVFKRAATHRIEFYNEGGDGTSMKISFRVDHGKLDLEYNNPYLKKQEYTYTGKAIKPVITWSRGAGSCTIRYASNVQIGTGEVILTPTGNYGALGGSIVRFFDIYPAKVKTPSVKAGKKKMTVRFAKVKGGVKYEVQYRLGKKGKWKSKKIKTSKVTIKKLKAKKKYQVRVRAYKKVGELIYSGDWSKTRTIKIK